MASNASGCYLLQVVVVACQLCLPELLQGRLPQPCGTACFAHAVWRDSQGPSDAVNVFEVRVKGVQVCSILSWTSL